MGQIMANSEAKQILVIEDDEDLNNAYGTILTREGFVVEQVKDGQEGIEILPTFTPDLILLDLRMARMDGVEFLRQANLLENLPETKVIVFTNFDFNDEIQQAFDLGANRYVLKAMVTPKQLAKLVREELDLEEVEAN